MKKDHDAFCLRKASWEIQKGKIEEELFLDFFRREIEAIENLYSLYFSKMTPGNYPIGEFTK